MGAGLFDDVACDLLIVVAVNWLDSLVVVVNNFEAAWSFEGGITVAFFKLLNVSKDWGGCCCCGCWTGNTVGCCFCWITGLLIGFVVSIKK